MSTQTPTTQERIDSLKNHWLYWLIGAAFALITGSAGVTWAVISNISVQPKVERIQTLEKDNADLKAKLATAAVVPPPLHESPIVLRPTALREHESVTTTDGECQISAESVSLYSARLKITVGADEPVDFTYAEPGKRLKVGHYYVDVLSVSGSIGGNVEITVSKH